GIVPLAIVATVLLVALLRTQQARLEETAGAEAHALAALLVIVLVASGLFAWLIGRRIAGAIHAAASAAAAMSSGKPLPLVPSRVGAPRRRRSRSHADRRRSGYRAAAGARRAAPGRSRQSSEGRVPRDARPRAEEPARRDRRRNARAR